MSASLSRLTAVGAAALMLLLAGCAAPAVTATKVDARAAVAVGDCIEGTVPNPAGTVDPDHDAVVPCTEPHSYEVIAVEELPDGWVEPGDPGELEAQREALLTGELRVQYRAWATTLCIAQSAIVTGLSSVDIEGVDFSRTLLRPLGAFATDISLTSAERWADGEIALVCAIRYFEPKSGETRPIAMPEGRSFADLYREGFPLDARVCMTYEPWASTPCTEPHWLELVGAADLLGLDDPDLVARLQAAHDDNGTYSDEDQARIDAICAPVIEALSPQSDVAYHAIGTLGGGWLGEAAELEVRDIWCGIAPEVSEDHDATGSFFDGPGAVTLVPIA